jgi:bifunctional non-homologous end joining protein LigD
VIQPMLATLVTPKAMPRGWIYEPKLDGVRVIAKRSGKVIQLLSRTGRHMEGTYPEIVDALARGLRSDALVDGELIAIDPATGLSSFNRLQPRIHVLSPTPPLIQRIPVELWLFDCLAANGDDLRKLPWSDRRDRLERLVKPNLLVRLTPILTGKFERLYARACKSGAEGLIGKRADSAYQAKRSGNWVKLKCVNEQEFVVIGWTDPKGTRSRFGALLLGYYVEGELHYGGRVGTGFDEASLARLKERLDKLGTRDSPLERTSSIKTDDVHWVRPSLVVQVGFSEWTPDGLLRHPRYLGLREDKKAKQVVRETASRPGA